MGESNAEEVDEGVGQENLESAILSANSIRKGLEDIYGIVARKPSMKLRGWASSLGVSGNIARTSESVEDVQAGVKT